MTIRSMSAARFDDGETRLTESSAEESVGTCEQLEIATYRAVFMTAVDAIITISSEGQILDLNPAAEKLFGYERSELLCRNVSCLMPDPFSSAHDQYLARYLSTGERHVIGIGRMAAGRRSDGTVFPIELSVSEVRLPDACYFTGIVRDISDRESAKLQLQASNEALVRQNIEITCQTEKLRQTAESAVRLQQAAEAASQAKSVFLANVSHELRTPLTAVLGFSELIQSESQSAEIAGFAETIHKSGEQLLKIVEDLLTLSASQRVDRLPNLQEFDPAKLLREILQLAEPRAAERGLTLSLDVSPEVPDCVESHPRYFRQVVEELISNAVKFTPSGAVHIRMTATPPECPVRLSVDVIDTGIGISAADVKRLFQPFEQVDSSPSRRFGGVGLGLAICQKMAEELGGGIAVSSTPGRGSMFTFWIPCQSLAVVPFTSRPFKTQSASDDATQAVSPLIGARILVVEDDPVNVKLLSRILTRAGAVAVTASDGHSAVEVVQFTLNSRCPFTAILMDLNLPVMDGFSATAAIRALGYTGPIIAVTANATPASRESSISAGVDDYVTKPFSGGDIRSVLERHLLLRKLRAAEVESDLMWE